MSAHLYINPRGVPVTSHSYSSGELFRSCPKLYQLTKLRGWRRKDKSAALKFGRALEAAIQFYHANGLKSGTGVDEFKRLWLADKDNTELKYTKAEVDWKSLYRAGAEMLRLYEVMLPTLPIKDPVFQAQLKKKVFPGTTLDGLEDQGFVDMISKSPWVHPLLPKVDIPKGSPYRPLIIDIKTSGKSLDENTTFLVLDPQLQRYAWLGGILDTAFLNFVKSNPLSYEKGTEVTVLEESGKWTPGMKGEVFKVVNDLRTLLVGTPKNIERIEAILGCIKGRGSGERKEKTLYRFMRSGRLTPMPIDSVTKQKLQFLAARMSEEYVKEAGQVVAHDMVQIVDANQKGFWPRTGGVRWPNNKCVMCSHRGICLKDDNLRDALLERTTQDDDWLDEIGEEE